VNASVWVGNCLANMEEWRGIFSALGRGGLVGQRSGSICGCGKDKLSNSVVYMGERGKGGFVEVLCAERWGGGDAVWGFMKPERLSEVGVERTNVLSAHCVEYVRGCCFLACIATRGGCCHMLYTSVDSGTGPACTLGNSSCDRTGLWGVGARF